MGERRRAREHALSVLFQIDLTGGAPDDVLDQFWGDHRAQAAEREFAERLVRGVRGQQQELDRRVSEVAEHWRLERMAVVDRNVLRIAVWELLFDVETPPVVIIDEAIDIGKKFGSGESGGFINGILDTVRRRVEAERIRPPRRGAPVPR